MKELSIKFEPYMEYGSSAALKEAISKWLEQGGTLPNSSSGRCGKDVWGNPVYTYCENAPRIVRGGQDGCPGEYDDFFFAVHSGSWGPHRPGTTHIEILAKLYDSDKTPVNYGY